MILGLYALIAAALFYLGSRAMITAPIWRLYPSGLARFMDCPACTGFWWGCLSQFYLGRAFEIDVGPLPWQRIETIIIAGLCTLVLTPIVTGLMQRGFEATGSAFVDEIATSELQRKFEPHGFETSAAALADADVPPDTQG